MTGITTIFKNEQEPERDKDKLVDLFRNRVELKKEFAALRSEKYQLQDRIKEQRGTIERVEQKLGHLESLLLDPEWVHNVVVFYQFRRLATHCQARIERFAENLKQQREQRVHGKVLDVWNKQRKQSADQVRAQLEKQNLRLQMLEDQLQAERHSLTTMGGFQKLLQGKSQVTSVQEIETAIVKAQADEGRLQQELGQIGKRTPPDHGGLSVKAKRSINFMILSLVQQLYLDYAEDDLAALAKESSEKSVGAVNYGSKADCDELLARLQRLRAEMEQAEDRADVLKARAKLIAKHAVFRNDEDSVAIPGTVATVFDIDANGVVRHTDANLLGENYFGVSRVLSR